MVRIEEDMLNKMAYGVGIISNYLIYVNSNDSSYIPHFHMVDKNSRGKDKKKGFHTCIRIDKPEYFNHEGKEDRLNSGQIKELVKFLSQLFKDK